MGAWSRFWRWYEDKILGSIIIIAVIQFVQIPHMVWNADLYLQAGIISRVHPALDWLLYGVDLIEIVSIINVGMIMYSLFKKRRAERRASADGPGGEEEPRGKHHYTLLEGPGGEEPPRDGGADEGRGG